MKMKIERGGIFNRSRLEEEKVIMFGISYVKCVCLLLNYHHSEKNIIRRKGCYYNRGVNLWLWFEK